jgi:hypothetical protein
MMTNTYLSRNRMKPVLGAIAVAAAMATLGLAVVAPAALSTGSAPLAPAAKPTEVAILPGTLEVVGKRTKVARADNPYVPAAYRVR